MKTHQLVLDDAKWKVTHSDGTVAEKYNEINHNKVDYFELQYKDRRLFTSRTSIFKLKINGKTLIHRLKSKGTVSVGSFKDGKTELVVKTRIRVTALLQRNQESTKNKSYGNFSFDPALSEIYYIFEDGKIEKRNDFGKESPYLPLELFPEELEHLMKGT